MTREKSFYETVEGICKKDNTYKPDSYEFVMQALKWTQKKFKKAGHLTGQELARGCAAFAIDQYGPMAKIVLKHWGIVETKDFGAIVYNMIGKKLLAKTENDSQDDFKDVYDFEAIFNDVLSVIQ